MTFANRSIAGHLLSEFGWMTLLMSVAAGQQNAPTAIEAFVSVNGITLHYVDWGGTGPPLLFLTGLGDTARAFDGLAVGFTDRFHVLGLTRRGQGQSEKPPSGYDPRSLAEDIRAFLDAMKIERVILAGFSAAGSEETQFAGTYPERVDKLVYLDSAEDYKSGHELATNPLTRYPLPLPHFDGPIGEIVKGAELADPDYTKINAPALSFVTIYDSPYIPADADAALREKIVKRWNEYGNPFQRHKIDHFKRDMKNGRVIELLGTDHGDFVRDANFQKFLTREMRKFLLDATASPQEPTSKPDSLTAIAAKGTTPRCKDARQPSTDNRLRPRVMC